jgi:hypothetical protein
MNKQEKKRRLLTILEQEFGPVAVGARPKLAVIQTGSVKNVAPNRPQHVRLTPQERLDEWHRLNQVKLNAGG